MVVRQAKPATGGYTAASELSSHSGYDRQNRYARGKCEQTVAWRSMDSRYQAVFAGTSPSSSQVLAAAPWLTSK
jgi:hypothetical protein